MKSWMIMMFALVCFVGVAGAVDLPVWDDIPMELHGYVDLRGGYRLQNDPYQKDMSVMEARTQLDLLALPDWGEITVKGDVFADGVQEQGDFDLRELNATFTPHDRVDLKVGRQILTWGVGDLVFINDMFPKDWQSFFIGRDTEYLKAPSDAVKASIYLDDFDLDVIYTPQFDADRHITGEYISYWNGTLGRRAGRDAIIQTSKPDHWFTNDEVALRASKRVNSVEYALYGYWGYWKSPGGYNSDQTRALFPDLNVYGASVQGPLGKGLVKGEIGFYDSREDRKGTNALVNNSEMRYLVGYERELARELTGAVQYYIEQMLDYSQYRASGGTTRDEFRHLITVRLTQLLMNQNLQLSLFTYYSPSDEDAYLRPNIRYKVSDALAVEVGGNVFWGDQPYTFFGQFEDNTNAYTALRYSF